MASRDPELIALGSAWSGTEWVRGCLCALLAWVASACSWKAPNVFATLVGRGKACVRGLLGLGKRPFWGHGPASTEIEHMCVVVLSPVQTADEKLQFFTAQND